VRAGPSARNSHQGDGLEGGIPRLLLFQSTLIDDKTLRWTMKRMQAAASAEGTVGVREGEEVVWRQAAAFLGSPSKSDTDSIPSPGARRVCSSSPAPDQPWPALVPARS
jgi:hypothetical protein